MLLRNGLELGRRPELEMAALFQLWLLQRKNAGLEGRREHEVQSQELQQVRNGGVLSSQTSKSTAWTFFLGGDKLNPQSRGATS